MASIESNHRLIIYRWGDCERVGKFHAALNQLTLAQQVGILLGGLVKMLLFNWVSLSFIAWASNSNEIVESFISISPHCDNASWLVFRPDFQRYWVFFAIYEFLIMFLVTEIFRYLTLGSSLFFSAENYYTFHFRFRFYRPEQAEPPSFDKLRKISSWRQMPANLNCPQKRFRGNNWFSYHISKRITLRPWAVNACEV